jgi:hypothetical protein
VIKAESIYSREGEKKLFGDFNATANKQTHNNKNKTQKKTPR